MEWRVLRSPDQSHLCSDVLRREAEAEWNMAYDAALLEDVATNRCPPTLRLYRWKRPAITVGRFQNIERTLNVQECEAAHVPIVRRITGGRGILHGTDLTISLAAPVIAILKHDMVGSGVGAIYAAISGIFLRAFRECGVMARRGRHRFRQGAMKIYCIPFSRASLPRVP
jgi:lipoyl(octanoyl) transferase